MLCGLWNTALLVFGCDKLNHYTWSLKKKSKNNQVIAMDPKISLKSKSIQRNDYKNIICYIVSWLIILLIITNDIVSVLTWCIWTNLSWSCWYVFYLAYEQITQTVLSSIMVQHFLPDWLLRSKPLLHLSNLIKLK